MKCTSLIGALVSALAFGGVANAATVTLNLEGIQPRGGRLLVAVQSRDQYLKPAATSGASLAGDISGEARVVLPNVAPGEYAITVLHDFDGDMNMAVGPDGKPLEGWTTRDAASLTATPTFDQVKYTVSGDLTVSQTMIYGAAQ